eukprot:7212862-Alexandrium_andersonii.AAC.1
MSASTPLAASTLRQSCCCYRVTTTSSASRRRPLFLRPGSTPRPTGTRGASRGAAAVASPAPAGRPGALLRPPMALP